MSIVRVVALVALLLVGVPARGAEEWSVGLASVVITPPKPVALAGYAARTKPFESVDQEIHAKALVLKDAQGHQGILVTMDLCILPKDVGEQVRQRIADKTHVDVGAILLNVAHSHSAPAVSLQATSTEPGAPRSVNAADASTVEYTKWLQDRLVEVAEQAAGKMEPAKLSWGTGFTSFVMNRRQFTDKGVILGVNPRGVVDRSVPVLRVDGADGKPRAVVFGYACHNTTNPSNHLGVSGDYAGYAQAYVEAQMPGVLAMFVTGCAGDSNPFPRTTLADAPAHGETLGKEVRRVLETKLLPVHGPLACTTVAAALPLQVKDRAELERLAKGGNALSKATAQQTLDLLAAGKAAPSTYHAPVAAWQFGKDLTIVGLSNEVVVDYVTRLEENVGPMRLWVAGYCNEVCGYIPSDRVLREGGYETRGLYTDVGWFAPGVETAYVNAAKAAAAKAGREMGTTEGK